MGLPDPARCLTIRGYAVATRAVPISRTPHLDIVKVDGRVVERRAPSLQVSLWPGRSGRRPPAPLHLCSGSKWLAATADPGAEHAPASRTALCPNPAPRLPSLAQAVPQSSPFLPGSPCSPACSCHHVAQPSLVRALGLGALPTKADGFSPGERLFSLCVSEDLRRRQERPQGD